MRGAFVAATVLSFLGFGADNVNFDSVAPGNPPPDWTFVAPQANRVRWEVRHDPGAPSRGNVLEKVTPGISETSNSLGVFDKVVCRDGDLSVKFRIDGGARSKTAGVVWRYQDPGNYYLLHFSANEGNIVLFLVRNGRFQALPMSGQKPGGFGVPHDIRAGQWYVVKVIFRGSQIRVQFGNRRLFEAQDSGLPLPGRTGIWTRGRTVASFDDFRIDKKG
jgi:hypothetical protein